MSTILQSDELEVGMLVTALDGPTKTRESIGEGFVTVISQEKEKGYCGSVWVILEIMRPFIVVEEYDRRFKIGPRPLDTRDYKLMRVTPEYAAALSQATKQPDS